jgi:hypothetical protein
MVKIYFTLFIYCFVELIQSLLDFLLKFRQSLLYTGRSQVIDKSLVYILYSFLIHIPIIPNLKLCHLRVQILVEKLRDKF